MKRTVGMVGRALIAHPAVGPQRRVLQERRDEARLADPGLAGNQDHLALALPRQLLAREREFDLCLAADKADRAHGSHRLEAALRCGSAFDRPDRDRLVDALDLAAAEAAKREQVAKQLARRSRNDNRPRLRQALQPRSDVRCIADHRLLL